MLNDRVRAGLLGVGLGSVALWMVAETAHRHAAPTDPPPVTGPETLLVLGCPPRADGTTTALQRWRVDLAAANAGQKTRFVFSGAGEAAVMATDLVERHGIVPSRMRLEAEATSTWENIGNAAELIERGGVLRIISDPLHVARAEGYWRARFPDRAGELRPARLYTFGSHPWLKLLTAGYDLGLRFAELTRR